MCKNEEILAFIFNLFYSTEFWMKQKKRQQGKPGQSNPQNKCVVQVLFQIALHLCMGYVTNYLFMN